MFVIVLLPTEYSAASNHVQAVHLCLARVARVLCVCGRPTGVGRSIQAPDHLVSVGWFPPGRAGATQGTKRRRGGIESSYFIMWIYLLQTFKSKYLMFCIVLCMQGHQIVTIVHHLLQHACCYHGYYACPLVTILLPWLLCCSLGFSCYHGYYTQLLNQIFRIQFTIKSK